MTLRKKKFRWMIGGGGCDDGDLVLGVFASWRGERKNGFGLEEVGV